MSTHETPGQMSSSPRWRLVVWTAAALAIVIEVAANAAGFLVTSRSGSEESMVDIIGPAGSEMFRYMRFEMHIDAFIFVSAIVVGAVILVRFPRHGFGWSFFLGWGFLLAALHVFMVAAAWAATDGAVSATTWLMWVQSVAESLSSITIPLALVIYPTGHAINVRWRRALGLFVSIGLALAVGRAFGVGLIDAGSGTTILDNPLGIWRAPSELLLTGYEFGFLVFMFAALIVRYVRARSIERQQTKWVFAVAGLAMVLLTISGFIEEAYPDTADALSIFAGALGAVGILAIGMAILRYRLYDIDIVISKTVTFGVLAGFITGVYALVVVGVGSLIHAGDGSSVVLSVVAVGVVAVVFEPVRVRVQRWANRLVYGKRATPYEVLVGATARLAESSDPDEVLGELTGLVVEGTGASVVVLWLVVGGRLYPRVSTPVEAVDGLGSVADLEGVEGDRVVGVRHRGEVLGALSVTKGRGDVVTGADVRVMDDVAAGAGVLLRNIGLNAELVERAEQLRVSRRRLVAAQDAERHRLERDLHDGAQQQVVALKVKLGIARTLAEREDAARVAELVSSLADTTQEAVDSMRAVAHGIYPPLLEAEGLVTALGAAKRTIPIPVEIVATGIGRYDRPVEESIYFAVLGILTNAVDAGATRAVITLTADNATVGFTIDVDTNIGDLTAIQDRIDALNGIVETKVEQNRSQISGAVRAEAFSPEMST